MNPEFHRFFPLYQRNLPEFELIVEKRDGYVRVCCPNLPNCIAEGESVKEAVEQIADKIARSISLRIRRDIRNQILEISKQLPEAPPQLPLSGSLGVGGLSIGKFPLNLN